MVDGLSHIIREVKMEGLVQVDVAADRAPDCTRRLIRLGFPVGLSSGLNYQGALECARQMPGGKHRHRFSGSDGAASFDGAVC